MKYSQINDTNHKTIIQKMLPILQPWTPDDINLYEKLNQDINLITDLGFDSVAILQLILETEKEFQIKINDHELDFDVFSRFANFIELIERKLNETN